LIQNKQKERKINKMAQCDLCYADDEDITETMLNKVYSNETDDYFFMYNDKIVCFDCYYIRDKWENNEERAIK
jgi:hypothetical protein